MCDLIDMEYDEKSGSYIKKKGCEIMDSILVLNDTLPKDKKIGEIIKKNNKSSKTYNWHDYYDKLYNGIDWDECDLYGECYDGFLFDDEYYGFEEGDFGVKKQDKKPKEVEVKENINIDKEFPFDFNDEDDVANEDKEIFFYYDINNPTKDNTVKFTNVLEFSEFLDASGIYICDNDINKVMMLSVMHCCINPYDKGEHSEPIVMVDTDLVTLQWSCDAISERDFE